MTGEVTIYQNKQCLTVVGHINFHTVIFLRQLGENLMQTVDAPVIDFNAVQHCDSSGLALMMAWLRKANQLKKVIRFVHVPSALLAIADVCNVSELFKNLSSNSLV